MYHPTLKLAEAVKYYHAQRLVFNIVQIGTGGNGGYLVQRLSKLLFAFSKQAHTKFRYTIVDGDHVEPANLLRQPFIEDDMWQPKAKVLAERYEGAYRVPIFFRDEYVESVQAIRNCFDMRIKYEHVHIPILIGCVDNNATRQLMHDVFHSFDSMLYIDSGIDAVDPEAPEDVKRETGYSGQVVCGAKFNQHVYAEPIGAVYPDILEDRDSRLPTQACGETVLYYPQRMQTNEVAALVLTSYLNTLLFDHELVSHYTNFNARTSHTRPVYLTAEQVSKETAVAAHG